MPDTCTNCGNKIPVRVREGRTGLQRYRNGWCKSCWHRWKKAGCPASGPGQPWTADDRREHWHRIRKLASDVHREARLGRVEDARWLRDECRLPIPAIALRMELAESTIQRYLSGH